MHNFRSRRSFALCACLISVFAGTAAADSTYHYEPVPGKLLGIFPDVWTIQRMVLLRSQYGFSRMFIGADQTQYGNAIAAGFAPSAIIIGTSDDNYIYAVDNLPAGIYYIDEAAEHDCYGHPSGYRTYTPSELATRRDYIHNQRPGALFVISGYKRCSHNQIAATYADFMMYSSYKNWDQFGLPVCHVNMGWGNEYENPWIPGSDDQRNSWTSMRQTFGSKFSMTWIHGGGDEYADLFAHANTLGLTEIWQYNGAPIDSARLESFCYTAWQNGWLARVPNEPLPVQLASFTAAFVSHDKVQLRWLTLSELNNYGFEVQRRALESPFATLPNSFIPGQGTSVEPHQYEFTDSMAQGDSWFYRLKQIDLDGTVHYSGAIQVSALTGVQEEATPLSFRLLQNYPNPFNPATKIRFDIPQRTFVWLAIHNSLGEEVDIVVARTLDAGEYAVNWDATGFSSGIYFYRLLTDKGMDTKKLLLLK